MGTMQKVKKYKWLIRTILHTPLADKKRLLKGYKARRKYYTHEGIEANLKEMIKCATCPNMCRFDCPALQLSKRETYSPANKARIGYFMGMGKVPMENPSAIKTMYACMGCDACQQWCPMDISTGDLLVEMRHELDKRNLLPAEVNPLKEKIEKTGSIFEESPFTADSEFNINMPNPEVFYYIGCMSAKHRPDSVRAHIAILKKLGIPFVTAFDKRECCGSPLFEAGHKPTAIKLSEKNQTLINASTAPLVISDCPGCVGMLKITYGTLNHPLTPKVQHSMEFFEQKLREGKLKPSVSVKKTVTYHDPCVLARKLDQQQELRALFAAIPDLNLQEAYCHGRETQCCGYGSIYHLSNSQYSDEQGQKRLTQLRKFNPDYIVSACPTCEYALEKAQNKSPKNTEKIKDFAELLAESLGLI